METKIQSAGLKLEEAEKAVIMIHGRGATNQSILQLSKSLPKASYLAPQAQNNSWYPKSFLRPTEENQPDLENALKTVEQTIQNAAKHIDRDKIVLLGFSQGACLVSEYAARNPRKYGGLIIFSGGLIGEKTGEFNGDLEKTPAFIGCSENDPHIPLERVNTTEKVLSNLDAEVEKTIYSGRSHTINQDEIKKASKIISAC